MKRFILILTVLSLMLVGCNAEQTPTEPDTQQNTESDTETLVDTHTRTLTEDTSFSEVYRSGAVTEGYTIKGESADVVLSLPKELKLRGDLTLSNLTLKGKDTVIYANGYKLTIDSNVKSSSRDDRLTVYGGAKISAVESTDITLLGGYYKEVWGGGDSGNVNGSTNVIFGGHANEGDTNDDDSALISPCNVYGGGKDAWVGVSTNVTVKGSAVAKYVSGTGTGYAGLKVPVANINIEGGKIMNVFGGSLQSSVSDIKVNIVMKGGLCEAIFGGCQAGNLTGDIDIKLLGGNISRRLYTGCYNNCDVGLFSETWTTHNAVIGTTTLSIASGALLCTGEGLSSGNSIDMGIYCGSRYSSAIPTENNILIFLDGCYDTMIHHIGPSSKSWYNICESHHNEIIKK